MPIAAVNWVLKLVIAENLIFYQQVAPFPGKSSLKIWRANKAYLPFIPTIDPHEKNSF